MTYPETSAVFEYPSSGSSLPSVENTSGRPHLKSFAYQMPDLPIGLDET